MKTYLILRDENTEWDGGDDIEVAVARPVAVPAGELTQATNDDKNAAPEPAVSDEPNVILHQPESTWRMTKVPQPEATHPGRLSEKVEKVETEKTDETLPNTYAELLAEIRKLGAILQNPKWQVKKSTRHQRAEQRAEFRKILSRYEAAKKKSHDIQQGMPTVFIGANELATGHASHAASLRRKRWEILAKSDMHFQDLLNEHDKLEDDNSILRAQVSFFQEQFPEAWPNE